MEAVMILVDLIGHPHSNVEQIARRLKSKQLNIDVTAIRQLLKHHGLLKKTVAISASDA
jgi:predicted deacylase